MDRLGLQKSGGQASRTANTDNTNAKNQRTPTGPAVQRAAQVESSVRMETITHNELQSLSSTPASGRAGGASSIGQSTFSQFEAQQAAPQSNVNEANTTSRVVRGLSAMVNQHGGSMTMRLDPPDLGSMRIQMQVDRGVVTAQFYTTTAEAQSLLSRNLGMLRQSLEQHGLTVERIAVHQSSSAQSHAMRDNGADQQQSGRHDQSDAGDGRSRGRHDGYHHARDESGESFSRMVRANGLSDADETFSDDSGSDREGALQS